ncbi:MAG: class I SAM-dependent methyltransferase [Deltaproteobacteria bacterium]|nr:MAG: class I SAM-dependent methyltransferase [Deltaproteobacteria bacterium]
MRAPELQPPSPFFEAQRERLRAAARLGPVLDVACGRGRHALAAAELGAHVVAIDRSPAFLSELQLRARERALRIDPVRGDLEAPAALPVRPSCFGAVLVFRFLHRPLAGPLAAALRPGGLLLYETFTERQREVHRGPSNPDFLLREGELRRLFAGLDVLDYEECRVEGAFPQHVARLAARRPVAHTSGA